MQPTSFHYNSSQAYAGTSGFRTTGGFGRKKPNKPVVRKPLVPAYAWEEL